MHFFLERPWRQVSNMILKVKIYPHEFHFCSLRLLTPKVCEKDKRTFILIQMMVKVIRKKIERGQLKNNKGDAYVSLRLCYLFLKIFFTLPHFFWVLDDLFYLLIFSMIYNYIWCGMISQNLELCISPVWYINK